MPYKQDYATEKYINRYNYIEKDIHISKDIHTWKAVYKLVHSDLNCVSYLQGFISTTLVKKTKQLLATSNIIALKNCSSQ